MNNDEDDELLFDSLFNKKQTDPFHYYLDLIIVIMLYESDQTHQCEKGAKFIGTNGFADKRVEI